MKQYRYEYHSPMGVLQILSDGSHITGIRTPGQAGEAAASLALRGDPVITAACDWLDAYFSGKAPPIEALPLQPAGTNFQMRIWQYLLHIPWGETVTYGQLAEQYACEHAMVKMSAQAVGQAIGANPIPIIIPCHRVLGSGHKLTGYTGGIEYKKWLLEHENIPFFP